MLPFKKAQEYLDASGKSPYARWFDKLDATPAAMIDTRIRRAQNGNFGDSTVLKATGGVRELRLDDGPGYRVYLGEDGDLLILLCGGVKKTQASDVEKATSYWDDYKKRKNQKKDS